jgi:prolyl oligopeptidase
MKAKFVPFFAVLSSVALTFLAQQMHSPYQYPKSPKVNQVDDYHGTKVEDPYRWLEDDRSPQTEAWVAEQNKLTFGYLSQIPFRAKLRTRLDQIYNYPKYSAPEKKRDFYFFFKNSGLQNQAVLYIQKGLKGTPEVLIDPNTLSADGTTRLHGSALSKDARYLAYQISRAGSDWQEIDVMDLANHKPIKDKIEWVKFSGIAWAGDGFYYSRYAAPRNVAKAYSAKNENQKVYYHRVGTPQAADPLIYEDSSKTHPERLYGVETTRDERFAVLSMEDPSTGKDGDALLVRDLTKTGGNFRLITDETFAYKFGAVGNISGQLLVHTNKNAPNWKLVLIDPAAPEEKNWREIIPETKETLNTVQQVGGKLIATYMKDVSCHVLVFDESGKYERDIPLPTFGTAYGFEGEREDTTVFYTFTSFTFPPTIYLYDLKRASSKVFRKPEVSFKPEDYETRQVFYPSKDGTHIPMYIIHRKGLKMDGQNPALLYAYGGFNISLEPWFDPLQIAWLEQGGIYAQPNLRGGGEYGEKWHEAGMKKNKQNVFDDFIAAAEWLKTNHYTSTQKLAIHGGSNGGLLIGAAITQSPDLCKVALPSVGVMDMLRYHKFTIGFAWATEFGSADDPAFFPILFGYSPLHNLRSGVSYPATLVTTADHDDRVVPAHSFKFIAALQEKQAGPEPVLIRIETQSGHGSSSTTKRLDETADSFAFAFYSLGLTPKF